MQVATFPGDNHHYQPNDIMPRHFQKSAVSAGIPDHEVTEVVEQRLAQMPLAIELV